jgi:hypothetical protein
MLSRKIAFGSAVAAAFAVAVLITAFSASSASRGELAAASLNNYIPNYMLRWDNSLLTPAPLTPAPSH